MKIAIIYGSVREGRQGIKAARFITNQVQARSHEATLIDPEQYDIPMFKKHYKSYDTPPQALEEIHNILQQADGFIIVSAEYNHSMPPALTNLMNHFVDEYKQKPSAIVSYSSGNFGGVRAAMQLRAFLPEIGTTSIPTVFPISQVQHFKDDGTPQDAAYNDRANKFLDEFDWYLNAFKQARKGNI